MSPRNRSLHVLGARAPGAGRGPFSMPAGREKDRVCQDSGGRMVPPASCPHLLAPPQPALTVRLTAPNLCNLSILGVSIVSITVGLRTAR